MTVDAVLGAAGALGAADRLRLLRELLVAYGPDFGTAVEVYSTGTVIFATDDPQQRCPSLVLVPGTHLLPRALLAFFVLVALLFVFLGIALISDLFMEAIETITSAEATARRTLPNGRVVEWRYQVVNPTIANLTLMALGSSAPEIFLSIIGTVRTLDRLPDELGPSTIVGSAAFNLLCISAIVIIALPDGQTKKIKDLGVFCITATFSVVAYVWLYIVLQVTSAGEVEIWEACVTLCLFVLMLILSYGQAVKWRPCAVPASVADAASSRRASKMEKPVISYSPSTSDLLKELATARASSTRQTMGASELEPNFEGELSTPQYHTGFMRGLTGQRRLIVHDPVSGAVHSAPSSRRSSIEMNSVRSLDQAEVLGFARSDEAESDTRTQVVVRFSRPFFTASSAWTRATVVLLAEPPPAHRLVIMWAADASSPSSPSPFAVSAHTQGEVVFEAGQATAAIFLELHKQAADAFKQGAAETERRPSLSPPLPHSSAARSEQLEMLQPLHKAAQEEEGEEREEMVSSVSLASEQGEEGGEGSKVYFRLVSVRVHGSITQQAHVSVGAPEKATLVLLPLSAAQQPQRGTVGWAETAVVCVESVGAVSLLLERTGGLDGTLSLSYRTRDGTAIVGADYKQAQGTVTFLPGVSSMSVHVHIVDDEAFEETEHFFVDLSCEEEGVLSGESVCTVSILDDDSWREKMSRVRSRVRKQLALSLNLNGTGSWAHKFTDALVLSGGIDDETGEELPPSAFDSLMHSVTLFWKLQFALVPPVSWASGWPAFFVSICFIGAWTAVVGEISSLFGCVIGLGDAITAITFVAVGTSLPDTFASRLAILNDEFADAAVGNVTGSNAVNVFLGLGIPWLIASIYHAYSPHGAGKYLVPASGLSFSVVLFTSFAVVAISLLFTRRFTLGGEIGGNARTARLTAAFLFTMWLVYIVLVSLNVNGIVTALS